MSESKISSAISYLYLKSELEKIKRTGSITENQVKSIENDLKSKLGLEDELCWI